jgi:hypothetical protein
MVEKMENWMEDLLMSLLECGYKDLERLNEVLSIAKKFDITIDDILNYAEEITEKSIKFNDIMYSTMRLVLDKIAENVEDEELAEKIRDHEIFVNWMDSWFNIEALDNRDLEQIEKTTKEQLIKDVIEEIKKE